MSPNAEDIARELIGRGVDPAEIARINPTLGRQAGSGLIAPRLVAPDKIAERGAYIRDYGQINKDRDALGRTYPMMSELDRFEALNEAETGGILNQIPLVKDLVEKIDPRVSEMSGIASNLQGKARPVGSGATSDYEQRLYRMGVPSPEKQGPTNQSIIAYMKGVMNEENDRLAFQEEFLRRNGSLSGSQQAWARYVTANPYTVTGEGGRSRANTKRTDWKAHFGVGPAPAPAQLPGDGARRVGAGSTASAPKRPDGWSGGLPKAQRAAALMFKGASAPAGDRRNPYVPTSPAQFAKLPPGAWVVDDDGTVFQKGAR